MSALYDYIQPHHRVLDLCSGPGTFRIPRHTRLLVSADAGIPQPRPAHFVQADAHHIPFATSSMDLVIAAHCLEHVREPEAVLREIGRVLTNEGLLYLSVPRWDSLTDRLYRSLYPNAGGHISPWRTDRQVIQAVQSATGLRLLGHRKLYSSLRFLTNTDLPPSRRKLIRWATPGTVSGLLWLLWKLTGDRYTDYGWEFYFGSTQAPPELEEERDVCCGCGAGHSAAWLDYGGHITRRRWGPDYFRCPDCRRLNVRRNSP